MSTLEGARLLVVGASGGLGAPLSRSLAAAGARLILAARSRESLEAIGLTATGHPPVALLTADLRDPAAPSALVASAADALGGLDGVLYAAGVVAFGPVADLDDDVADDLLVLNYLAPVRLARAALPLLTAGGVLAGISAVVAERPQSGMAAYSASKAALSAFYSAFRPEARRQRIRVLDIRPPHTETGLAGRPLAGVAPRLPRGLQPEQVADRIVRALIDDETDLAASTFGTSVPAETGATD